MKIILASTSPARRKILNNLGIPFECASPICDETPFEGENAVELVNRLAMEKARSLLSHYSNALIIGADQVCVIDGKITGKPHTFENAKAQLQRSSGKKITFYTGMCLIDTAQQQSQQCCEPFHVHFRTLSDAEIEAYIRKEEPYACAGSFRCDSLGITLFERLEGNDLNALIGLPLIQLNKMLIARNLNPLLW